MYYRYFSLIIFMRLFFFFALISNLFASTQVMQFDPNTGALVPISASTRGLLEQSRRLLDPITPTAECTFTPDDIKKYWLL